MVVFFFSSRRRHTRWPRDWSSDVCSSDLDGNGPGVGEDPGSGTGRDGDGPGAGTEGGDFATDDGRQGGDFAADDGQQTGDLTAGDEGGSGRGDLARTGTESGHVAAVALLALLAGLGTLGARRRMIRR